MTDESPDSKRQRIATAYLRELRVVRNLTQKEVGDRVGRLQTFISDIEKNRRSLGLFQTIDICRAMGVPYLDFAAELLRRLDEAGVGGSDSEKGSK